MSVSARLSGESREPASEAAFPRGLLFVLAGASVANLYYAQPLLAVLYVTSNFLGGSLGASLASLGWAHAEYGHPYMHWG